MHRSVALFTTALLLVACGTELRIESTTSWSGYISESDGGRSVVGSGDDSFGIDSDSCWTIQKDTDLGFLRAYAEFMFFGVDGDASTAAPYGIVSGCA